MLEKWNEILHEESLLKFIEFNIIYFSTSSQEKSEIVLCIFFFSLHNLFDFLFEAIIPVNAGQTVNNDNFYLFIFDIYIYIHKFIDTLEIIVCHVVKDNFFF